MKDLTKGDEGKLILGFAWPLVLGNLFQNLYNIVDSIVVGQYIGKEALAAVGASFPIIYTLISLIIGIGSGASIVISQYFGAKQNDKVLVTIDTLFIFFMIVSLIVSFIGIPLAEPIFKLMQLSPEIIPHAIEYIHIYLLGIFVFFGFNGISSILRGIGDSKTPLYFMIISAILNIGLDLLFVTVFHWGISGVAWATIIAQGLAFITAAVYLNKTHPIINLGFRKYIFSREVFRECARIGLPTGFQQAGVAIGLMIMMSIVNTFGTNTTAAYTAALRIDSIAKMPAMNFSAALSSFVGQNLGAGLEQRARNGLKKTVIYSAIYALMVTILINFFGETIMSWFTDDQNVIRIGNEYLVIVSSFYVVFSAMFTMIGMLRGAGDTLIPLFITLFNLWLIRVPFSLILVKFIGEKGIWWSFPTSWILAVIFSFIYYKTNRWRGKVAKGTGIKKEE